MPGPQNCSEIQGNQSKTAHLKGNDAFKSILEKGSFANKEIAY